MSAPFRISRSRYKPVGNESDEVTKGYLSRLVRMIPSEVLGLYLAGIGIISSEESALQIVWLVTCLVAVLVTRVYGTYDKGNNLPPQWPTIIISMISFIIWAYSMGGPFIALGIHRPALGSLMVMAWSYFIPLLYRGTYDDVVETNQPAPATS